MASTYLHGTYGSIGATQAQSAIQSGTTPVYIGTAPVNLVRNYKDKGIINAPVRLSNWTQAQNAVGYSSEWDKYTLCEAMDVHFNNALGNCGPVYVINVLDPEVHVKKNEQGQADVSTAILQFTNGRAEFYSTDIILDTFAIEQKVEGTDYELAYNYAKGSVIVTSTGATQLTGTYQTVDTSLVTTSDIIGSEVDGVFTGMEAVNLLYQKDFKVTNLLAAPGWSHNPDVYTRMVSLAQGAINQKWIAFVLADIPVAGNDTMDKAIAWKTQNAYNSAYSKVCWPQAADAAGKVYHISTLAAWKLQMTDEENRGIPGETCSNKAVPAIKQHFGTGKNQGFDQASGNNLNEKGITTVVPFNGKWVLWGGHTAAYTFGATDDALEIFDTNVRMLAHIVNSFQIEWAPRVDKPMTIQLRDEILHRENDKLAGYVAQGFLVGDPVCVFEEAENNVADIMNGDFKWQLTATPTPQFKSGTISVSYTDAGLSVYTSAAE